MVCSPLLLTIVLMVAPVLLLLSVVTTRRVCCPSQGRFCCILFCSVLVSPRVSPFVLVLVVVVAPIAALQCKLLSNKQQSTTVERRMDG